jgi:mycothiol synthase
VVSILKNSSIRRLEIDGREFTGVASWIHRDIAAEQLANLLCQLHHRTSAHPVPPAAAVFGEDERPIAAAYFTHLPGKVAALGGVRFNEEHPEFPPLAVELLRGLCVELQQLQFDQIQAILPTEDTATPALLTACGFQQVSMVQYMWLTHLDRCPAEPSTRARAASPFAGRGLRWLDAAHVPFRRLAQLIDDTFVGTLDCPALNGLRSQQQVLEGFLEGVSLRSVQHWEVLELDGELVGCLFLKRHDPQIFELGYMGIRPEYRGWGLGHELLARLVIQLQQLAARCVVVAVDADNWPAVQLYLRHGFVPEGQSTVWLYAPKSSYQSESSLAHS